MSEVCKQVGDWKVLGLDDKDLEFLWDELHRENSILKNNLIKNNLIVKGTRKAFMIVPKEDGGGNNGNTRLD